MTIFTLFKNPEAYILEKDKTNNYQ